MQRDKATPDLFRTAGVFPSPADIMRPDIRTRSRTGASRTSHDAALRIEPSLKERMLMVLSFAKKAGIDGITSRDITRNWPDASYSSFLSRASELKRMRWLILTDKRRERAEVLVHRDYVPHAPAPLLELPPALSMADLRARVAELEDALDAAVKVAGEAAAVWDKAPEGVSTGKLLIALSGRLPGYRADIDRIHEARRA